jgi:hypothetical protein
VRRHRRGTFPSLTAALLLVVALLLAGCSLLSRTEPRLTDDTGGVVPCRELYSETRCALIVDAAALQLGLPATALSVVAIVPEPNETDANGNVILHTRSGGAPLNVRVGLPDGTSRDLFLGCVGVDMRPFCQDEPVLQAESYIGSGYRDTPCTGEPPAGCATPVPTPAPRARADAEALRIARLDIPIDHAGDYRVRLGEASLPNGWLSDASFAFVDEWPEGVTILSGRARMALDSLEADGKPFDNVYAHGWRNGTERVAAFLVFHVDRFEPGAVLSIRDVVVR